MSYQVLARKYRPKRFQELVGQDVVARALTHALEQNRLHHAYLFTGTRGVGKTTIARILSRCLNCETGITATPCGVCGTCREIDEGRFVDLIEVDAASRTKVEDTRELMDNVQYAPTRGRYKVYLIDEVHMLSGHSFNALLKTLEEPPPHVKFLLATTDPQKLPITILSRCLQFALKPMTPERVVGHLQQVLQAENIAAEEGALWLLARGAQGSMRDALSLTDQAIAFGHGALRESEVRTLLGSIDRDLVFRVLDAIHVGDAGALLKVVAGMAEQSIDFTGALAEIITVLHRLAVAQSVPDAIDNAEGDRDRLLDLAAALTAEDVQLYYQMALHGRRDLPLAVDARAGFEMTVLRMLNFRPAPAGAIRGGAANAGATGAGAVSAGQAGVAAAPAAAASVAISAPAAPAQPASPIAAQAVPQAPAHTVAAAVTTAMPSASPFAEPASALVSQLASHAPWETAPVVAPVAAAVVGAADAAAFDESGAVVTSVDSARGSIATSTVSTSSVGGVNGWTPESWADWVEHSGLTGAAINLARHTLAVTLADGRWQLQLSPRHQMLSEGQAWVQLQAKLSTHFAGRVLALEKVEPNGETPAQRRQRIQLERRQHAETALRQDPVVKAIITTFGAELIPDSLTLPH